MNTQPEARPPQYPWGLNVIALDDLFNDGSYPERPEDDLLVARGTLGEIVNVGAIESTGDPVYIIEFANRQLVGVFEDEIVRA